MSELNNIGKILHKSLISGMMFLLLLSGCQYDSQKDIRELCLAALDNSGLLSDDVIEVLDAGQLDYLTLINVDTEDGTDPTCEVSIKPDDTYLGETITNNKNKNCSVELYNKDSHKNLGNAKIKIRGNTSAAGHDKKPYKLKFEIPMDLLGNGESYCEWILLKDGHNFNVEIGNLVSNLAGVNWAFNSKKINLVLNGDWKGSYILIPSVSYESSQKNLSARSIIFELDPYWWKEGEVYFRTDNQLINKLGYTFKYPDVENEEDEVYLLVKKLVDDLEKSIKDNDETISERLDMDTMASWLLARDVLGNGDPAGANLYLYLNNMNDKIIKAGPLWDFDASFTDVDEWSKNHSVDAFYFSYLMKNEEFLTLYNQKWQDMSVVLEKEIEEYFHSFDENLINAIDISWKLDNGRWNFARDTDYIREKDYIFTWFTARIDWLNKKICGYDANDFEIIEVDIVSYIDLLEENGRNSTIGGWAFSKDAGEGYEIGILCDGRIYVSDVYQREDVKELYLLDNSDAGFNISFVHDGEYEICLINADNHLVYVNYK